MISSIAEITSPSDWPETLLEMRNIDNLLRCSICKEFFDVAMLIQECAHNYCSLCIRQSINHKTQCPTCSVKVTGNDLKCNRVLDELVTNFVKVRSKLLALLSKKSNIIIAVENKDEMSDDTDDMFMKTPRGKNIVPKKKVSKGKSPQLRKRKRQKIVESDSEDSEFQPVNVSIKHESATPKKANPVKTEKPSTSSTMEQSAGSVSSFVECPVCSDMINSNAINGHLDACLTREEKKSSLRRSNNSSTSDTKPDQTSKAVTASSLASPPTSSMSSSSSSSSPARKNPSVSGSNAFISNQPKRKPLPQLVYTLVSDKQLKLKLKERGLSTQGSRQTLIKRHQEFVTIYNAQCDASSPKPASLIVKEIEIREKQKQSKKLTAGTSNETTIHSLNKDSSTEEVDKARKTCLEQHGDQFQQIISNLRKRKKKTPQTDEDKTTVSHMDVDRQDVAKDTDEIPDDKTMEKQPNISSSSSSENKTSVLVDDTMDTTTSRNPSIPTDAHECSSIHNDNCDTMDISTSRNSSISMDDCEGNSSPKDDDNTMDTATSKNPSIPTFSHDCSPAHNDNCDTVNHTATTKSPCISTNDNEVSSSTKDDSDDCLIESSHSEDILMQNSDNIQNASDNQSKSKEDDCSRSSRTSQNTTAHPNEQPTIPEPPSPSSLVFESQVISDNDGEEEEDGKRGQCLDSSPSLGLASDNEEVKELSNASESDSELFKTEIKRTPVRTRSLRTRKR